MASYYYRNTATMEDLHFYRPVSIEAQMECFGQRTIIEKSANEMSR